MLGRVIGAQFDLEKNIAELSRRFIPAPGASLDQLRLLANLQRQIGSADPAGIAALRADVIAMVAATEAAIQENRSAVADAIAAESLGLAGSSAAARQQVLTTMAAMGQYDLRFASPDDEADYHRREAERRAYIEAQLAKGTPEGNLNGAAGALGQMVDAKAHGAGDSPEFQQRWNELVATTERLREEVRRSGGSTAEFDNRLREDLRRILKARGLSGAQIDAQFAANPDPLEAAKALVGGDVSSLLSLSLPQPAEAAPAKAGPLPQPLSTVVSDEDALAQFRAAGIVVSEQAQGSGYEHGVSGPAAGGRGAQLG